MQGLAAPSRKAHLIAAAGLMSIASFASSTQAQTTVASAARSTPIEADQVTTPLTG